MSGEAGSRGEVSFADRAADGLKYDRMRWEIGEAYDRHIRELIDQKYELRWRRDAWMFGAIVGWFAAVVSFILLARGAAAP